jgi:hypothetical protein
LDVELFSGSSKEVVLEREEASMEKQRSEEMILTSKGLERTNCIGGDKFEIIFGERRVECNRFQAAFMSKAIHRVLCSDNTVTQFEVHGYEDGFDVIEEFSRLMNGFSIVVNQSNCESFRHLSRVLENDELTCRIVAFELGKESTSKVNYESRVRVKTERKGDIYEEVEFIASHFHAFNSSELEKLKEWNIDILERIFGSASLCLADEDSLLDFISSLGEGYSSLYGFVETRFLSLKGIRKFLSSISFEKVNWAVWESICRGLLSKVECPDVNCRRFAHKTRLFEYRDEFEGSILRHLKGKCGGNVHEKGVVNITSSSDQSNKCWQVADYGWNGYWMSQPVSNSWICFDFKQRKLSLQHYTLKSGNVGAHYPIQWEIEGSEDGNSWNCLDSRNTRDLCGIGAVNT